MRNRWAVCGLTAFVVLAGPALAGRLDDNLQTILDTKSPTDLVSVLVFLDDQVDLSAVSRELDLRSATLESRHEVVVDGLRHKADTTQAPLRDHLKDLARAGQIQSLESFWIVNGFRVDAPVSVVRQLAEHRDIGTVYYNYDIELIEPIRGEPAPGGVRTPEPGLTAIRAPEVWNMLGITGSGVLVATLDTGVDGSHPAVASRWAGLLPQYAGHPDWAFFDPQTGWTFPQDSGSHGTHTMGTVCGGAPGDEVGVAPGATWIHAAVIDRVNLATTCAQAILAFQWLIDPDGNPGTFWDVPAVCSNSWRIASYHNVPPYNAPCDPSFWSYLDACHAAGITMVFAAGNEGSSAQTVGRPADRATDAFRTCAVAAVDGNTTGWPVAGFSSRGPTYCTPGGGMAIKPDVAAPGVSVRSAYPGGGYYNSDGTSMATPHVAGVVALMKEACPSLLPDQIIQILYDTAVDLGPAGKDNDYGWGMVDAYNAVLMAAGMCGPQPPRAFDGHYEIPVNTPTQLTLSARDYDEAPYPLTFEIVTLPAGGTLADAGTGHVIVPSELPYVLASTGNVVTYAPNAGFYGDAAFTWQATDGGAPPTGGYSNVATTTLLVLYGPPTVATQALPTGCPTQPYGPFFLTADQGQPVLAWSLITDQYIEVDLGSNQFAAVGTGQNWRADDNSWNYALPFTFPFFGQMYTQCWLTSNGFINFGGSSSDWSNSDQELIDNARICPLWDDLRTDRTGGDIFIYAGIPGQVTFRWQAVTYSGEHPCNFSCTLYADGSIRLNYGTGNSPVTPTIGISAGNGTQYLFSTYNGAGSLTSANSHDFLQPVPLPDGLWLTPAGEIGGTPTVLGTFEPRFRVTDALGRTDVQQLTLVVQTTCPTYCRADCNCSGDVDWRDIDYFVAAMNNNQAAWMAVFAPGTPACGFQNCDVNADGVVNWRDIDALVALMNTTCP